MDELVGGYEYFVVEVIIFFFVGELVFEVYVGGVCFDYGFYEFKGVEGVIEICFGVGDNWYEVVDVVFVFVGLNLVGVV